jgi:putative toxin-antitoxin system antitoxin component (TIGR02293 family)
MKQTEKKTKPFDTRRSIQKAREKKIVGREWSIVSDNKVYVWSNKMERVKIIREGIPYGSIEVISKKLNRPVKSVLSIVGLPQTTYNKKKHDHALFDSRNSELILLINELLDYGLDVFNNENEKFERWLKKPNLSLGGNSPENLLDTITGINEVKFCLNRLEFGNLA